MLRGMSGTQFLPAVGGWIERLPRLRNVVRQRLVGEQLDGVLAARPAPQGR